MDRKKMKNWALLTAEIVCFVLGVIPFLIGSALLDLEQALRRVRKGLPKTEGADEEQ